MSYQIIVAALAGLAIGPFVASYGKIASEKINKRDLEYNEKAKANGEELIDLPEGMNLYKNNTLSMIIITALSAILLLILSYFTKFDYNFAIFAVITEILLGISIVDFQVYEIPIECNGLILLLGIIHLILDKSNWLNYLIGFAAVSLIFLFINLITKGKGMGGGDVKLMATLGLLLGWKLIIFIMILGCILGACIHGLRMLISKKEHVLAFGPYLSMAAYIGIIWGNKLVDLYLSMFKPVI